MTKLKFVFGLIVIMAMGLGIGVSTSELFNNEQSPRQQNAAILNPLPKSIDELVKSSDVIVIGKVGEIINQEMLYGDGSNSGELAKLDKETRAYLGLPVLDYEIIVDKVILGDAKLKEDMRLVYRIAGEHDPKFRNQTYIKQGDIKLLFLSANPDGKTYGISSFMHMMNINGSSITYYYEGEERVAFNNLDVENVSSTSGFISEVKKVVAKYQLVKSK